MSFLQSCVHGNDSVVCSAPNLNLVKVAVPVPTAEDPYFFHYGFIMDKVLSLRNLSSPAAMTSPTHPPAAAVVQSLTRSFTYYPDPSFEPFPDGKKQFFSIKNEYLTINVCNTLLYNCRIRIDLENLFIFFNWLIYWRYLMCSIHIKYLQ